jgi:hypothetical protein
LNPPSVSATPITIRRIAAASLIVIGIPSDATFLAETDFDGVSSNDDFESNAKSSSCKSRLALTACDSCGRDGGCAIDGVGCAVSCLVLSAKPFTASVDGKSDGEIECFDGEISGEVDCFNGGIDGDCGDK